MIRLLKNGVSLGALIDQRLNTGDPITFFDAPPGAFGGCQAGAQVRFNGAARARVPARRHARHGLFRCACRGPFKVRQSDDRQGDTDRAMAHIYARFEAGFPTDRPNGSGCMTVGVNNSQRRVR